MIENRVDKLSERQRDCLRLVAQLRKTEQIAAELGISPSTVNTHIERAVAVLGVAGRREAARLVIAADAKCPDKPPTDIPRLPEPEVSAPLPPPTPTAWKGRRNDLIWTQRLALAILALVLLCIALGGLGAAIEQLSNWRTSLARP